MFDVHQFIFRLNWARFKLAAGLNLEPLNPEQFTNTAIPGMGSLEEDTCRQTAIWEKCFGWILTRAS